MVGDATSFIFIYFLPCDGCLVWFLDFFFAFLAKKEEITTSAFRLIMCGNVAKLKIIIIPNDMSGRGACG